MGDPIKHALEAVVADHEARETRMRTIAREETGELRHELVEEINNNIVDEAGRAFAVMQKSVLDDRARIDQVEKAVQDLQRDLKWILAIPRAYRALRERIKRLVTFRRTRRTLVIAGGVLTLVGGVLTVAYRLYSWPQLLNWLKDLFGM